MQQLSKAGDTERLFVAVPLTDQVRQAIAARLGPLPGRLIPQANWHFTLRFLGATTRVARDKLVNELHSTSLGEEFAIRFDGIGAFPRVKRARIVWAGVSDGAAALIALAEKVESAVQSAGFEKESRAFTPHLTLSRIDPPQSVTTIIASQPPLDVPMNVREITLMQSTLGKGPARYGAVERFALR